MKTITINILTVLLIAFTISSCGQQEEKSPKQELQEQKAQLLLTQENIARLEKELLQDSSFNQSSNIFVDLIDVKTDTFEHFINITGNIESENQAFISPEINGQIKQILVKEGQRVKYGDAMIILNSEITQRTIDEVKTNLELARTVYKKQKELWNQKIGSEIQYLQAKNNLDALESKLETLRAQQRMATIRAPYSGVVDEVFQHEGEMASPGRQILQLINLVNLKVYADMSERYLPYISIGDPALVSFPTYPNIKIEAKVHRVGNMINHNNRTVKIQINIKNVDEKLKPNIISNIKLRDFYSDSALVLPSIIIKQDLEGDYIFVAHENEKGDLIATKRYVTTGISRGSNSLIIDGVKVGEQVVFNGYNNIRNGSTLKINKIY